MATVNTVGNGYYNYYNVKSRMDTTDGKAVTVWYERDLSKEEICNDNSGVPDRNYQGADLCRKLADAYRGMAESNRAKYSTAQDAQNAIWAKYTATKEYSAYSHEERVAMARNELNMTLYGYINLGDVWNDPHLKGEVSKNKHNGVDKAENRSFNMKTLSAQFMNLWNNNGIDASKMNGSSFLFKVNGMDLQPTVMLLGGKNQDESFIESITKALNSNENASNLFFNLLYDASKLGKIPKDSLTKWKIYSDFKNVTGQDIRDYKQTDKGFVNKDGRNAIDVYSEALKISEKVPREFKGVAKEYFSSLVDDAMRYDIEKTPDIELTMEYRDGSVYLNTDKAHVDFKV